MVSYVYSLCCGIPEINFYSPPPPPPPHTHIIFFSLSRSLSLSLSVSLVLSLSLMLWLFFLSLSLLLSHTVSPFLPFCLADNPNRNWWIHRTYHMNQCCSSSSLSARLSFSLQWLHLIAGRGTGKKNREREYEKDKEIKKITSVRIDKNIPAEKNRRLQKIDEYRKMRREGMRESEREKERESKRKRERMERKFM